MTLTDAIQLLHGIRVLVCAENGPKLAAEHNISDFVSLAFESDAALTAIPVARLAEDFFILQSRLAGETAQKFVNYGLRLAIVGDISRWKQDSKALRDFVYESNLGKHLWFVADLDELSSRLAKDEGKS